MSTDIVKNELPTVDYVTTEQLKSLGFTSDPDRPDSEWSEYLNLVHNGITFHASCNNRKSPQKCFRIELLGWQPEKYAIKGQLLNQGLPQLIKFMVDISLLVGMLRTKREFENWLDSK
ncbi:hypothetical protein MA9V2_093 [Chryseobacterium phage MA9V-2]|nr:hypothetical protein MA9V2_093 [Chryseobacterium phage MA9V-2]